MEGSTDVPDADATVTVDGEPSNDPTEANSEATSPEDGDDGTVIRRSPLDRSRTECSRPPIVDVCDSQFTWDCAERRQNYTVRCRFGSRSGMGSERGGDDGGIVP